MDFPFTLPGFETQALAVRLGALFKSPLLIVNGVEQPKAKRLAFTVVNDTGSARRITLKPTLFDAVPSVQLDDEKLRAIVPKLAWFEYVWLGVPFARIAIGGALGGLCGGVGVAVNSRVFRTREGPAARWGITGAVTFATILAYLVAATLFQMAIGKTK